MEDNKKLNIVMFPWLAFGHMLPFLQLSKRLATKGHHIFFVSTPRNLKRLPNIPENLAPLITLVPLPLPRVENLPPNAEATTDVGFSMGFDLLKKAYDGLQDPMKLFLENSVTTYPLDWIIYDFSCYWLPPIAEKLGIQKAFFSVFGARMLTILGPLSQDNGPAADSFTNAEFLTTPPPWIPFPKSTVYFLPYEDFFSDLIVVRGCLELEGEYLQLVDKLIAEKTVLPVGLLPPSMEESPEDEVHNSIFGWLKKQRSGSVVYVALGSEVEPSQEQLTELALGLELSKLPFLWAFRRSTGSSADLPDGFVERTQDHGLVWMSWAPQLKILQHDSVGGFLTHAGFSSIIETLMFGKPLIMLPLMVDQGINARFMVEIRVGVEIPRNKEDGSFTRSSVAQSLTLVLKDEAGKMYRDEAKKYKPVIANESLHGQYIDKFINHLINYKFET
uniref:Glycosyltransferase n=1 Tax=Chenopodium quinoa TaxID=63459 RepID=A0A803M101_CHEQI